MKNKNINNDSTQMYDIESMRTFLINKQISIDNILKNIHTFFVDSKALSKFKKAGGYVLQKINKNFDIYSSFDN